MSADGGRGDKRCAVSFRAGPQMRPFVGALESPGCLGDCGPRDPSLRWPWMLQLECVCRTGVPQTAVGFWPVFLPSSLKGANLLPELERMKWQQRTSVPQSAVT